MAKKSLAKKAVKRSRKRAHNADGSFMADDPSTQVNEAYALPTVREAQRSKPVTSSSLRRLGGKLVA